MCKDTLGKLHDLYNKQTMELSKYHTASNQIGVRFDMTAEENKQLKDDINRFLLENTTLKEKLVVADQKAHIDVAGLTEMVSDKSRSINDLRWKMNDVLDVKRKVETDNSALQFELDNLRHKYLSDLREKYFLSFCPNFQGAQNCPNPRGIRKPIGRE